MILGAASWIRVQGVFLEARFCIEEQAIIGSQFRWTNPERLNFQAFMAPKILIIICMSMAMPQRHTSRYSNDVSVVVV